MTCRPPPDLVPPAPLTRADVLALDALVGQTVTLTEPGAVTTDLDGVPAGVGPARTSRVMLGAAAITRADADRLGITEEDLNHVHIHDCPA